MPYLRALHNVNLYTYVCIDIITNKGKTMDISELTAANLITSKDVCDLLKIDTTTLLRWRRENQIKCYRLGRRYYYSKQDILNNLQSNYNLQSNLGETHDN